MLRPRTLGERLQHDRALIHTLIICPKDGRDEGIFWEPIFVSCSRIYTYENIDNLHGIYKVDSLICFFL